MYFFTRPLLGLASLALWLCAAGGTLLAAGLAAASLWPLQGRPQPLILASAVCGLGFGFFQVLARSNGREDHHELAVCRSGQPERLEPAVKRAFADAHPLSHLEPRVSTVPKQPFEFDNVLAV